MENLDTPQKRLKFFIQKEFRTINEFCEKFGMMQQQLNKYINSGINIIKDYERIDKFKHIVRFKSD